MNQPDCIFCKIARGEIPCAKLYETETVLAFLDIGPIRPGHALVIPKTHFPTVLELDPGLGADLVTAFQVVGKALMDATGATGLNLGLNCNASAGQVVFHVHWHLIPRVENDGLDMWPGGKYASADAMNTLATHIRALVSDRAGT